MKRIAYACGFLVIAGIVTAVVLTSPGQKDGAALLISAAQAVEEAKTIHVRGRPNVFSGDDPPWGHLGEGHYENWYSPNGKRTDYYDADGNLERSYVMNVATGMAYSYTAPGSWLPKGMVVSYPIGSEDIAGIVKHGRERYIKGQLWFADEIEQGKEVTTRKDVRNGREITVVELDLGAERSGLERGTVEYYLDPATGQLLGLRQYGPESHGKPLVADLEKVEYGIEIASSVFEFEPPEGAAMLEDDFEVRDGGCRLEEPGSFPGMWRIKPTSAWHASASATVAGSKPESAIDGKIETRWTGEGKGHRQEAGMWFQLDLGAPTRISKLLILHAPFASGPAEGWPRGLQVAVTSDGAKWEPVYTHQASAEGSAYGHVGPDRWIKGVRLTLTESSDEEPWSIAEIRLYGRPE